MGVLQFSVSLTDGGNTRATTRFYANIADDSTLAEATASIEPFLALLNNVTGGKIVSVSATIPVDITGITPNTPGAGIYARSCGALSWPNVEDTHPWEFVIPGVLPALVSGNQLIQTEGGAVDLMTDIMGAAFTSHAADDSHFTDEDGANLALEPRGFHTFRKFGRNVRRGKGSLGV